MARLNLTEEGQGAPSSPGPVCTRSHRSPPIANAPWRRRALQLHRCSSCERVVGGRGASGLATRTPPVEGGPLRASSAHVRWPRYAGVHPSHLHSARSREDAGVIPPGIPRMYIVVRTNCLDGTWRWASSVATRYLRSSVSDSAGGTAGLVRADRALAGGDGPHRA